MYSIPKYTYGMYARIPTLVKYSTHQFVDISARTLIIGISFRRESHIESSAVAKVVGNNAGCKVGDVIVNVYLYCFRTTEVETLLGDPSKTKLGREPRISMQKLATETVDADYGSSAATASLDRRDF